MTNLAEFRPSLEPLKELTVVHVKSFCKMITNECRRRVEEDTQESYTDYKLTCRELKQIINDSIQIRFIHNHKQHGRQQVTVQQDK